MSDDTEIDFTSALTSSTRDSFPLNLNLKSSENKNAIPPEEQNLQSDQERKSSDKKNEDQVSKEEEKPLNESQIDIEEASPSRASPEPACSICLGSLQNKCFTDSCSHTFCFACLLEWSKVKAECPLCKVTFKSIVHNVRSHKEFDQYYVVQQNSPFTEFDATDLYRRTRLRDRSRLRGTINSRALNAAALLRLNPIFSLGIEQHRITYAPHSIRAPTVFLREDRPQTPRNIEFRQRVYRENLWAREIPGRRRYAAPEFFLANPVCAHRLVPWLTRELHVLLDNEHRVSFVLDFILSIILRYNIKSEEFFVHTQSYLFSRTLHFVHEFYNFASSAYEMDEYDMQVQYDTRPPMSMMVSENEEIINVSSDNSDDEYSFEAESSSSTVQVCSPLVSISPLPSSSTDDIQRKQKRIPKLSLKKNHESNSWTNVSRPVASPASSNSSTPNIYIPGISPEALLTTGNVEIESGMKSPISITLSSDNEFYNSDDGGECEIVAELKPKWMRTPEIVDLSSDSEKVEISEPREDLEPVSDGSFTVEYSAHEGSPHSTKSNDHEGSPKNNKSPNNHEISEQSATSSTEKHKHKRKRSKHSSDSKFRDKAGHSKSSSECYHNKRKHSFDHPPARLSTWSSSSSPSPTRERPFRPWSPQPQDGQNVFASYETLNLTPSLSRTLSDGSNVPEISHKPISNNTIHSEIIDYLSCFNYTSDLALPDSFSHTHEKHHRNSSSPNHKKHKDKKGKRKHEKYKYHKH